MIYKISLEFYQQGVYYQIMDENKLRLIVKEVVSEAVSPIRQQLNSVTTKLDSVVTRLDGIEGQLNDSDTGLAAINRRLDSNTAAVMELESTVNGYADMYKINDSNIRRMEKRLEPLEEKVGVNIPPEYQLEPFPEAA